MLYHRIKFTFALTKKGTVKRVRLGRPGTSLKVGLLGMANIGKSSTFNILSNLNVPAQNIPFCTIDPNIAYLSVHDSRFEGLCKMYNPEKSVGPILRIVDIAGLVKGASEGFGLGNEFLSHIMQVDALYHVVRTFPGEKIAHTQGGMDPARDIKIIRNQLIKKDLEIVDKKIQEYGKKAKRSHDKSIKYHYQTLLKVNSTLNNSVEIRNYAWKNQEIQILNKYLFLTSKPMIYLLNMSKEDYLKDKLQNFEEIEQAMTQNGKYDARYLKYSVQHEQLKGEEEKSQVEEILKVAYEELQICHFFTVGPDEVKAWPIRRGENAVEAGMTIHTDFGKAFINAEVIQSSKLLQHPQFKDRLKKNSRKQGKGYIVKDGDIVHFNCKIK